MLEKNIQQYSTHRTTVRAYLCYLFTRNIPNRMPDILEETIIGSLKKIKKELSITEALYILDATGNQIIDNLSNKQEFRKGSGNNRAIRAYYYRAVREKKCILTDPYPSLLTGELTVTASYPIYNDKGKLKYIACIDIALIDIVKITQPRSIDNIFLNISKITYTIIGFSLFIVAILLFIKGISNIDFYNIDIEQMFKSTILLTLALAIFDLVKAIFEEEVFGKHHKNDDNRVNKTMVRFIGSIIIALAIESLMLVFKFAITGPEKIIYAIYLIGAVALLMISLAIYIKLNSISKNQDTEGYC